MDTKTTRVTLKTIAAYVGLTPGTISAVLNNTRAADRIPQATRDRVLSAARQLHYTPNPLARALRAGGANFRRAAGEPGNTRAALVILSSDQFDRALNAIRQAGLSIPDDVSIVDLFDVSAACEHPRFASAPGYPSYEVGKVS